MRIENENGKTNQKQIFGGAEQRNSKCACKKEIYIFLFKKNISIPFFPFSLNAFMYLDLKKN